MSADSCFQPFSFRVLRSCEAQRVANKVFGLWNFHCFGSNRATVRDHFFASVSRVHVLFRLSTKLLFSAQVPPERPLSCSNLHLHLACATRSAQQYWPQIRTQLMHDECVTSKPSSTIQSIKKKPVCKGPRKTAARWRHRLANLESTYARRICASWPSDRDSPDQLWRRRWLLCPLLPADKALRDP